ncbi:MAG: hypothetical protein ACREH6_01200 [Geminicoccaceae bacterium]
MRARVGCALGWLCAGAVIALASPAAAAQGCTERLERIEHTLDDARLPDDERRNVRTVLDGARRLDTGEEEDACLRAARTLEELLSSVMPTGNLAGSVAQSSAAPPQGQAAVDPEPPAPAAEAGSAAADVAQRPSSRLTADQAMQLIGNEVVDPDGATVAKLVDLAHLKGDDEPFAVLQFGGFLGFGEREVVVGLPELERGSGGQVVLSDTAASVLSALPEYNEASFESVSRPVD